MKKVLQCDAKNGYWEDVKWDDSEAYLVNYAQNHLPIGAEFRIVDESGFITPIMVVLKVTQVNNLAEQLAALKKPTVEDIKAFRNKTGYSLALAKNDIYQLYNEKRNGIIRTYLENATSINELKNVLLEIIE